MKLNLLRVALLATVLFSMNSCSSDTAEVANSNNTSTVSLTAKDVTYNYSDTELATMALINDYRLSVGLNALEKINHISVKSEEHDEYMITNNVVNHNNFVERSEDIIKVLGARRVGENIAYNFVTPESVVKAWLNSPTHKENIEGDFTHFGIAIKADPVTGKKYFTNIFAKI
ncbi:hypothetical protein FFWV33_11095 [Flavobacterium faecale]|uniref:SCP domain-containing protein n=1 Tax=Flavobacterium faecale TaxID=1355330 RepID=A0A2S1LE22_9FLAO|nr:CAP domain-containing protein [Flavobacterium faecale]AWG22022.1 hypothetical protein FFWV33_11095 [Flavobacterium faecale]